LKFVKENKLQLTDLNQLKDVFTFCNDSTTAYSWIDHVVCSQGVDSLVSSCHVQYQYVSSDHKSSFVTFDQFLPNATSSSSNTDNSAPVNKFLPACDDKCDDQCLFMYKSELDLALADINIPNVYPSSVADTSEISRLIDNYYTDIMSCINVTSRKVIPCKKSKGYAADYIVPGWNDFARDKYDAARSAFLDWVHAGKARNSALNTIIYIRLYATQVDI